VSAEAGLSYRERPAAGDPEGLLVLHHGRGTDESDLLGLGDALDPQARLALVAPRAPLRLAGAPGYHWYLVPRAGYPDPDTFHVTYRRLGAFHEETFSRAD
jgi:phospholipase/carboxylesterase